MNSYTLHHGDCMDVLRAMPENSVDAIITDPPYGLSPDGKARTWDDVDAGRATLAQGSFLSLYVNFNSTVAAMAQRYEVFKPVGFFVGVKQPIRNNVVDVQRLTVAFFVLRFCQAAMLAHILISFLCLALLRLPVGAALLLGYAAQKLRVILACSVRISTRTTAVFSRTSLACSRRSGSLEQLVTTEAG